MKKIFKKSLACMLATVLCLTACICAVVPASASAAASTYSIAAVEVSPGGTADIVLTIDNFSDVKGAMLELTLPEIIARVNSVSFGGSLLTQVTPDDGGDYYITTVGDKQVIRVVSLFGYQGTPDAPDTAELTVNVTAKSDATVGTYNDYELSISMSNDEETLATVSGSFEPITVSIPALPSEPVLDESLASKVAIKGLMVSQKFGIDVSINLYQVDFSDFHVVFSKHTVDGATYMALDTPEETPFTSTQYRDGSVPSYNVYYYLYDDVKLYEMNLPIDITLYVTQNGVEKYYTLTKKFSEVVQLYYEANANDTAKRTLATSLQNLATAAQKNFAANGDQDNKLQQLCEANDFPNANVSQSYAITDYSGLKADENIDNDTELKVNGFQMLATPSLRYTISLGSAYYNYDLSKINITASYQSKGNNGEIPTITSTAANLSDDDKQFGNYALFYFTFDKIALYDTDKIITLTVTAPEISNPEATKTWTYQTSLENILISLVDPKAPETNLPTTLFNATAALGLAAHNVFPELTGK